MKSALVLGGGGITGIAWEVGILAGLVQAGVDVMRPDLIVGTSAGSVVGALLATGADLEAAVEDHRRPSSGEPGVVADMSRVMAAFAVLFDPTVKPREARARVGKMALEAAVVDDEAAYLARFDERLGAASWPSAPRLVITGVDAETGEPVSWDAGAGVPLLRAVAASCSVPCIFPPVTINGRRYIDGGVRSANNADLAAGADLVVVIAPMLGFSPSWPKERERLGAARVTAIGPDARASDAIGPNVMDPRRRTDALEAGLAQAGAVAAQMLAEAKRQPE